MTYFPCLEAARIFCSRTIKNSYPLELKETISQIVVRSYFNFSKFHIILNAHKINKLTWNWAVSKSSISINTENSESCNKQILVFSNMYGNPEIREEKCFSNLSFNPVCMKYCGPSWVTLEQRKSVQNPVENYLCNNLTLCKQSCLDLEYCNAVGFQNNLHLGEYRCLIYFNIKKEESIPDDFQDLYFINRDSFKHCDVEYNKRGITLQYSCSAAWTEEQIFTLVIANSLIIFIIVLAFNLFMREIVPIEQVDDSLRGSSSKVRYFTSRIENPNRDFMFSNEYRENNQWELNQGEKLEKVRKV